MEKRSLKPLTWQFFIESLGVVNDVTTGLKRERLAMYYLPKEQALTIVHTLRRVMLSSLTGLAITGIEWLPNITELSQVNGVKEPVTEILTSFQSLRFSSTNSFQSPLKLRLVFIGPGNIYGRHISLPKSIRLINPDVLIMQVTASGVVDINCYLEQGTGLVNQTEELNRNRDHFLLQKQSFFPLNTNFSPIIEINYLLQERILEKISFHQSANLVMWDITTDGTIQPYNALLNAANKASSIFKNVNLNLALNSNFPSNNSLNLIPMPKKKEVDEEIFLPLFILQKIQKYKILSIVIQSSSRRQILLRNILLLKSRHFLRKALSLISNRQNFMY